MSWVRIHDAALTHPKLTGLVSLTQPFALWIWGLSYCQTHLTNGLIPKDAAPRGCQRAVSVLLTRQLWELEKGDYRVHDYLDWNDSRELVTKRRTEAKARMQGVRERSSMSSVRANDSPRTSRSEVLRGLVKSSDDQKIQDPEKIRDPERESEGKPRDRSHRPIFVGQRLTVFEWQLENFEQILGPYTEGFHLHDWFFTLDLAMAKTNQVIPKRDGGAWLESQLVAECRLRGLPMATPAAVGKQTSRLAAALASIKGAS